jgi:hypothetical protein
MQERYIWLALNRSSCGLHSGLQPSKFSRLLLGLSSDPPPLKEDQVKTSFITLLGAFSYTTMLFELKSVGATYQRGIQQCLHTQLGRNIEAYVDDVVVKTHEDKGLISDLVETFDNLRKIKVKLNPKKCTFGVPLGKLLRYMISRHGIDPNPEKVSAITKMKPPESLHDA